MKLGESDKAHQRNEGPVEESSGRQGQSSSSRILRFPDADSALSLDDEQADTFRPRRAVDSFVLEALKQRVPLLMALNEHHRIENNAELRDFYRRYEQDVEKLFDDGDCIVGCTRTKREPFKLSPRARSLCYEYQFDTEQPIKSLPESVAIRTDQPRSGKPKIRDVIESESDLEEGLITLKSGTELPNEVLLVKYLFISTTPIQRALKEVTTEILQGKIEEHGAICDFLTQEPPRIDGHQGGWLIGPHQSPHEAAIDAAVNLQESALVIQGPPGCGKTYTASQIIATLVTEGKRVGVTSNSHAAIRNLLSESLTTCERNNIELTCITTGERDDTTDRRLEINSAPGLAHCVDEGVVVGATAWAFVRSDFIDKLDVLIVDEASQVSLANLVAMSRCARNLLVIGDQRQLGQPIRGHHNDGGDASALNFRLGSDPTVRPEHGIFLSKTYRLHPSICSVVSEHIYADRLEPKSTNQLRELTVPYPAQQLWDVPAGIVHVPVAHEGNRHQAPEEVDIAEDVLNDLLGRHRINLDGSEQKIGIDDILFVAPFNAQVGKLKSRLGKQARVGTVDKFQGQQAPVVVVSLCISRNVSSEAGLSFALDLQRMNVAVSRAQSLCVIICHPDLLNLPITGHDSKTEFDLARRVRFLQALCGGDNARSSTNDRVYSAQGAPAFLPKRSEQS